MLGFGASFCDDASDAELAGLDGEPWPAAVAAGGEALAHAPMKQETQTNTVAIRIITFLVRSEPNLTDQPGWCNPR